MDEILNQFGRTDAEAIQVILDRHNTAVQGHRIAVLGIPGCGKSTIARWIQGAQDMDTVLFPQLTMEEKARVFQKPWIPEVGVEMRRLFQEKVVIKPGAPMFATVVPAPDAVDFIIHLNISEPLLRARLARKDRPQPFELCMGVQGQLEADLLALNRWYFEYPLLEINQGK